MSDEKDEPLSRLLGCWEAPEPRPDLDRRVLAAYRRQTTPLWRRLLQAELRVPLPVAAGVLLLLLLTAGLAMRRSAPEQARVTPPPALQTPRTAELAVVSHTSLAGFRPVEELQARVVRVRRQ